MSQSTIGQKLIQLRGDRTQEEVANAIGISLSAIGMYERGERMPRDEIKIAIAKYFDTTVQAILHHIPNQTDDPWTD